MNQSKIMHSFYKELHQWIQADFPESSCFFLHNGICSNLRDFLLLNHPDLSYMRFKKSLKKSFILHGLDPIYPFNETDSQYATEFRYGNPIQLS